MKTIATMLLMMLTLSVISQETIQIGNQEWTAENLNIGTMIPITQVATDNNQIEKYCYNNLESNCDKWGGLYKWEELMQYQTSGQGLCPDGFRVPSREDWQVLIDYLGGNATAGIAVKEPGYSNWYTPYPVDSYYTAAWVTPLSGSNSSGFTALPGGRGVSTGRFESAKKYANFWTSSTYSGQPYWAYSARVGWNAPLYLYLDYLRPNTVYLSARCIKN